MLLCAKEKFDVGHSKLKFCFHINISLSTLFLPGYNKHFTSEFLDEECLPSTWADTFLAFPGGTGNTVNN
jgi:hypothetical protein